MSWGNQRYQKYGARKKVDHAGRSFASKLEAAVYDHLVVFGYKDIKQQAKVYLTEARILYLPDFKAVDGRTGEVVWVEAKGFETPVWRIKRKLWMAGYGPGKLLVFGGSYASPFLREEINPRKVIIESEENIE